MKSRQATGMTGQQRGIVRLGNDPGQIRTPCGQSCHSTLYELLVECTTTATLFFRLLKYMCTWKLEKTPARRCDFADLKTFWSASGMEGSLCRGERGGEGRGHNTRRALSEVQISSQVLLKRLSECQWTEISLHMPVYRAMLEHHSTRSKLLQCHTGQH